MRAKRNHYHFHKPITNVYILSVFPHDYTWQTYDIDENAGNEIHSGYNVKIVCELKIKLNQKENLNP